MSKSMLLLMEFISKCFHDMGRGYMFKYLGYNADKRDGPIIAGLSAITLLVYRCFFPIIQDND